MIGTMHLETESPSFAAPDVTGETFRILDQVTLERQRQDERWGTQAHAPAAWLAILVEEVGEVGKEVAECVAGDKPLAGDAYREELIQVAAVAIAAVEAYDYGAAGLGRNAPAEDPR